MKMSKMKLVTKTSVITAIILTVSMVILIGVSVLLASKAVTKAIDGEFSGIASQNGLIVQGIIDDASSTAQDLQNYLRNAYAEYHERLADQPLDSYGKKVPLPTDQSVIYNTEILEINHEIENYMLNKAWSIVSTNPYITGMGMFFEPYAYDEAIKDYSLYVGVDDAVNKTAQSYGAYSEYSANAYYQQAVQTLEPFFTKPYVDQGVTMITASYPIIDEGKLKGVITVDIGVDKFSSLKSSDAKYPTMNVNVLTQDGTYVYDAVGLEWSGTDMKEYFYYPAEYQYMMSHMTKNEVFTTSTTRESGTKVARYCYPVQAGQELWWAQSILDVKDLNKDVVGLSIMMIVMAVASLAAIVLVTFLFLKKMLKPIDAVVDAATEIANGNLNVQIHSSSQDEIGMLANTFQAMAKNLNTIIDDVGYQLGEMGSGNFRLVSSHEDKYVGQYQKLLLSIKDINNNLSSTLSQINQTADQVSGGSEQVSAGAQALSQGATEQASSVEELAATINEISSQIKETADNAIDARDQTNFASDEVAVCNEKMQEMIQAMAEITSKSNEIGKIIKTIEDIAFQTNILALNAAVEAARAGAAGKGFAVVADEVRNLASKSAEASKSTSGLIEGSIDAVEKGTSIVNETAEALIRVVSCAKAVLLTVDKIAGASNEQASSIAQISLGVDQVSSVVQNNSATAEESAAASEELSGQAQILKDLVSRFKLNRTGI